MSNIYFYRNVAKKKPLISCLRVMDKHKNYWADFKNSFTRTMLRCHRVTINILAEKDRTVKTLYVIYTSEAASKKLVW